MTAALPMTISHARQLLQRSADRLDAFGPLDHYGLSSADATTPLDVEVYQKAPALCQGVTVHGLIQGEVSDLQDLVNPTEQAGRYKLAPRLVVWPSLIPTTLLGESLIDEPTISAQPYNFFILKATWSFDGNSQMNCAGPVVYASASDESQFNDTSGVPVGRSSQFTWAFVIGTWDADGLFTGKNNENQPFLPFGGF